MNKKYASVTWRMKSYPMPNAKWNRLNRCAASVRQVRRPHLAIVVPGLVLHIAREQPHHAADAIRRPLRDRRHRSERCEYIIGMFGAIRDI